MMDFLQCIMSPSETQHAIDAQPWLGVPMLCSAAAHVYIQWHRCSPGHERSETAIIRAWST